MCLVMSWNRTTAVLPRLAAAVVTAAIVTTGAVYALVTSSYVPRAPLEISRNFIDLIQAGDLGGAYLLTDQGAAVGSTLSAFEANIRRQLRIDVFPTDRPVELIGTRGGFQSYGNRLRRWILGRKIDPDQVNLDYFFGPPFEIRLRSNEIGEWRITFFQSHAM